MAKEEERTKEKRRRESETNSRIQQSRSSLDEEESRREEGGLDVRLREEVGELSRERRNESKSSVSFARSLENKSKGGDMARMMELTL